MKRNARLLALALGATLLAALPASARQADLTVDQILAKHYEAIGGKAAWKNVQAIKQTGKMSMAGMEAPFTLYNKRPNKLRIEFEIQGMKGMQVFDGTDGWTLAVGLGSIVALVALQRLAPGLPGTLIVLVGAIALSAATTGLTVRRVRNCTGSTAKTFVGSAIARLSVGPWRDSGRTQWETQCSRGTRASTSFGTSSVSSSWIAGSPYCFATRSVTWASLR